MQNMFIYIFELRVIQVFSLHKQLWWSYPFQSNFVVKILTSTILRMSGHHFDWIMILSMDICKMSMGKIDEQAIIQYHEYKHNLMCNHFLFFITHVCIISSVRCIVYIQTRVLVGSCNLERIVGFDPHCHAHFAK